MTTDCDTRRATRCRLRDARHALAHAAIHDTEPEALERAGREVIEAAAAVLAAHPFTTAAQLVQVSRWTRYAARALVGEVAGGLLARARELAETGVIEPQRKGDSP